MTAEVSILRHSPNGTFDPEAGRTTYPEPAEVWRGWARIQRIQSEEVKQIGDRQVIVRGATVSLPVSAAEVLIADEARVHCYRDPDSGDPYLLDRPLWVHDVRPGSMLWQRDLVVRDAPPTSR